MNEQRKAPNLVRYSFAATAVGVLTSLPLAIRETPVSFVLFMFLGQPFLGLGFILFTIQVLKDLRSKQLL
ncbi:MAG TPA: hypothetical protein VKH43_04680 [Thermoanaerobaculia bacterium]|nr:hypothetical protein [Thermoanaerobaculia bacterium]